MDSPKEVIRQFERLEESAKTQEVVKEYLKALVLTGRLEGANLGHLLSRGKPLHTLPPTPAKISPKCHCALWYLPPLS
jgi:hypothetical protein